MWQYSTDEEFEFEKSENSPYEDEEDDLDLLLPCMESEEVNEEPKQEEKIQIVDKVIFNRQVNNNSSGKKNTGSSLMKNREQSFSVKDIVKSEENETVKVILKKAQKRKSKSIEECCKCKKFLTHKYMKDHMRRVHHGAN